LHAERAERVYSVEVALKLITFLSLLALSALAAEHAVLVNGSVLRVDRHEVDGATVRLYLNGGTVEFPAALVAAFEPAPAPTLQPTTPSPPPPTPQQLVRQAAARWGLPPEFLASVAEVESGYRSDAVSPKGAIGLMQLMPATAALLQADPNDPAQNAEAGARYLRELLIRYGHSAPLALAAYNAGPGAVDRHADIPPYPETRAYVQRVLKQFQRKQK
jgi:soluble lytic murein transglycosylase-like protein